MTDHPLHQIYSGDLFRHAMFHLQACIHLEEVELVGVVVVDELDRTGGGIVHGLRQ